MTQKRRRRTTRPDGGPEESPGSGPEAPQAPQAPEAGGPEPDIEGPAPGAREEDTSAECRVRELEQRIQRLQADFLNDTKRIARQAEENRKYAVEGLVLDLLPVFDALHSARQGLAVAGETTRDEAQGERVDAVLQGLDLVERELRNVLGRHGVERIEALGTPFDPTVHEAVFVLDQPDLAPSTVAQVTRPGFTLHGRVVRPAHVAVTPAHGSADPDAEGD